LLSRWVFPFRNPLHPLPSLAVATGRQAMSTIVHAQVRVRVFLILFCEAWVLIGGLSDFKMQAPYAFANAFVHPRTFHCGDPGCRSAIFDEKYIAKPCYSTMGVLASAAWVPGRSETEMTCESAELDSVRESNKAVFLLHFPRN
jgi:hypothetical protein